MTDEGSYWIVAFELANLAPRTNRDHANLYVALHKRRATSADVAQTRRQNSSKFYGPYITGVFNLGALAGPFDEPRDGTKVVGLLKLHLARLGHVVNPLRDASHRLYVIDLDADELGLPGKRCVYVGSTSKTIEERLEEHRNGVRSTKKRARAVKGINSTLTPTDLRFYSSWNAKVEEYNLGEKLKKQGFHVQGPVYRESGLIDPHDLLEQTGRTV